MKKYIFLLAIIFVAATSVYSQEPNEGDIQFWSETKVYFESIKRTDKNGKKQKLISPFVMGTIRIGQDVRHFVNERVGFGFDIRLNKYFKITPSYYYLAEQATENKKTFEHRVRFAITGEKKWSKVSLSNRNRIEFRLNHNSSDETRYLNRTLLKLPFKTADNKEIVTPFVSNEPFYSFTKKAWVRNEFSVGVGKKISKNVSGNVFYLLQNNKSNTLKRVNAFGVNLKFTID